MSLLNDLTLERKHLEDRIKNVSTIIAKGSYADTEKDLIHKQLHHMMQYKLHLSSRISCIHNQHHVPQLYKARPRIFLGD